MPGGNNIIDSLPDEAGDGSSLSNTSVDPNTLSNVVRMEESVAAGLNARRTGIDEDEVGMVPELLDIEHEMVEDEELEGPVIDGTHDDIIDQTYTETLIGREMPDEGVTIPEPDKSTRGPEEYCYPIITMHFKKNGTEVFILNDIGLNANKIEIAVHQLHRKLQQQRTQARHTIQAEEVTANLQAELKKEKQTQAERDEALKEETERVAKEIAEVNMI